MRLCCCYLYAFIPLAVYSDEKKNAFKRQIVLCMNLISLMDSRSFLLSFSFKRIRDCVKCYIMKFSSLTALSQTECRVDSGKRVGEIKQKSLFLYQRAVNNSFSISNHEMFTFREKCFIGYFIAVSALFLFI